MRNKIFALLLMGQAIFIHSCFNTASEQQLVNKSCGGCHRVPEPNALNKKIWQEHILPRMGAWLGVEEPTLLLEDMASNDFYQENMALQLLPAESLISKEDWEKIKNYYIENAPDSLVFMDGPKNYQDLESMFDFQEISLPANRSQAANTLLKYQDGKIYNAKRDGKLAILDPTFTMIDSFIYTKAISDICNTGDELEVLSMGQINPNNQAYGSLVKMGNRTEMIKGLYRPVFVKRADLNKDSREDYLIGSFGFHIGKLSWFEATATNDYKEHLLVPLPGSIQAEIVDYNGDGLPDIIALLSQAKEAIYLFKNEGKGNFKQEILIELPPQYGSSAFGLTDFDGDGHKDIILVNGDNADNSQIRKPYHGIRFYKNDGRFKFKEVQFYPLNGATGVEIGDFNGDGQQDIAVIANFAPFNLSPQKGFVLYLNKGNYNFEAFLSPKTDVGRWLVLESGDFDQDGDIDLVLGSHLVPIMVDKESMEKWRSQRVDLLVLWNRGAGE
jgi:hypothetical protein